MQPCFLCVTTLALLSATAIPANAGLITNGSFETGDFSGWTIANANGDSIRSVANGGVFFGGSSDGDYGLQMNAGNSVPDFILSQTITTEIGVQYDLTFDFGRYDVSAGNGFFDSRIQVEVLGTTQLLSAVAIDDRQDLGGANDPLDPGEFLQFKAVFVADSTSTTLRFTDVSTGTNSADTMADNFRVSAVPEPSSTVLFSIGFLLVLVVARRKRQTVAATL